MAKRLSETQKNEIKNGFLENQSLEFLAKKYNCTKLTIIRNLKKILGEEKYQEILNSVDLAVDKSEKKKFLGTDKLKNEINFDFEDNLSREQITPIQSFVEITPLEHDFNTTNQKDITSVPLLDIELPNMVFLIVKKEMELEIKYLKDYPEWQFLPLDDLNRKTIEIHFDLRQAKRFCNKDQKVIKVPNTDVFRIVSPILLSRGITRIITSDNLISI